MTRKTVSDVAIGAALKMHKGNRRMASAEVGLAYRSVCARVKQNPRLQQLVVAGAMEGIDIRGADTGTVSVQPVVPESLYAAIHETLDLGRLTYARLLDVLPRILLEVVAARLAEDRDIAADGGFTAKAIRAEQDRVVNLPSDDE